MDEAPPAERLVHDDDVHSTSTRGAPERGTRTAPLRR
jgi:hypothetical protein